MEKEAKIKHDNRRNNNGASNKNINTNQMFTQEIKKGNYFNNII